jgi:hypothetical protein
MERRRTLPATAGNPASQEMPATDLETAQLFQSAFEAALNTGDVGQVGSLLAPDVECVMPLRARSSRSRADYGAARSASSPSLTQTKQDRS